MNGARYALLAPATAPLFKFPRMSEQGSLLYKRVAVSRLTIFFHFLTFAETLNPKMCFKRLVPLALIIQPIN